MGDKIPATEFKLIRFWPLPFGYIEWHLITQVNDGIIDSYITDLGPRRIKRRRLILFLVYDLVYPSISSTLSALDTPIPWSESIRTHTYYPFSRKPPVG